MLLNILVWGMGCVNHSIVVSKGAEIDPMMKSIRLYNRGEYEASINMLNSILNKDRRYYTARYYLMLNYFKLEWWEMSLKEAQGVLPYAREDFEIITIQYIIKYCTNILKKPMSANEKKEFIEFKKKNKKVLKKYGFK